MRRATAALSAVLLFLPSWSSRGGTAAGASGTRDGNPSIVIATGLHSRVLTRAALLARSDLVTVSIADDASYHHAVRYRAVPLADLVPGQGDRKGTLEAKALDGFAAEIPLVTALNTLDSAPKSFLAIEDPDHPWPRLPGKPTSAGPFYMVWTGRGVNLLSHEYWPYQLARIGILPDLASRVPALAIGDTRRLDDPVVRGSQLFAANCLVCHQIDGEGEGHIGPDLDRPMNPVAYFQRTALHRYIRNPASLRHWPAQSMPSFDKSTLSDRDIDRIIAYLGALQERHGDHKNRT